MNQNINNINSATNEPIFPRHNKALSFGEGLGEASRASETPKKRRPRAIMNEFNLFFKGIHELLTSVPLLRGEEGCVMNASAVNNLQAKPYNTPRAPLQRGTHRAWPKSNAFLPLLLTAFSRRSLGVGGLMLLLSLPAVAQTGFVQQDVILQTGVTTPGLVTQQTNTGKQTTRTYVDGLSRPIQTVAVEASPLGNDMIQPVAYDNLSRQTTGYLPYAGKSTDVMGSYRPNAITTDQPNFYNQTGQYTIPIDANPYAQQVFDNSPLQRMLTAGSIGSGYQPGGGYVKNVTYRYNTVTDAVWIWSSAGVHTSGGNYTAGQLSVTDGVDEDLYEAQVFTDMAGRVVLKRQVVTGENLDTYYIYDDAGMLYYTVPPRAVALMTTSGNYSLSQTAIASLIFNYIYDGFGRMVKKIIPGNVTLGFVYDPMHRPVLIQDANMAANNQWNYIKYDAQGRAISQGIYTDGTHLGVNNMQNFVNTLNYSTVWYETRSSSATNHGYYSNQLFPTSSIVPLAYVYYDNYTLGPTVYGYKKANLTGEVGATTAQIKGMPTMVQKSTIGSGMSTTWLISVSFYDHNLHPIEVRSNNLLYTTAADTGTTDYKTVVPDFTGMPLVSLVSKQTGASATNYVQTNLTYDPVHRVTAVSQNYNGGTTVNIAAYVYSEAGQLVQKKLGASGSNWLQLVDFRYNIRGQLTSINNSTLTDDGGETDDDPTPLFGMTLLYDQQDSADGLSNTAYHNGRLSLVKWMTRDGSDNKSKERSFSFTYDGAMRYNGETYAERTGTGSFNINHGWDEQVSSYNENGNIVGLTRNMEDPSGNVHQIDNLTYTYNTNNPNQLQKMADGTGSYYTGYGFINYTGSTSIYQYDTNGNITTDPYKNMTIQYNVLNLTDKMTLNYNASGRYIYYVYDAGGTVLRKLTYDNGSLVTQTDYIDGFVYVGGTLSYIPVPEGRVNYSAGTFTNEYIMTDYQGNARISFNNTGTGGAAKVVQEDSYYGFGLILPYGPVSGGDNKNLYNGGSEWQNDFSNQPDVYQTFNRNYDASLGRFGSLDPMPDKAANMSPYHYAANLPVMFNDPAGAKSTPPGTLGNILSANGINEFNQGGDDSVYGTEYDYIENDPDLPGDFQDMPSFPIANLDIIGNEGSEPLTSSGTYDVATSSLLDQAREGATVIGGETMYSGQGSATQVYPVAPTPVVGQAIPSTDYYGNMLNDVYITGKPIVFNMGGPATATVFLYLPTMRPWGKQIATGVDFKVGINDNGQLHSKNYKFLQTVNYQYNNDPEQEIIDDKYSNAPPFYYSLQQEFDALVEPSYGFNGQYDRGLWDFPHNTIPWVNGNFFEASLFIVNGNNNTIIYEINWGFTYTNGQFNLIPVTGHTIQ